MASTRLEDLQPALRSAWEALSKAFHQAHPGWRAVVVCTYRTPEEQFKLFAKGRRQRQDGSWAIEDESKVVTYKDGFKLRSRHNDFPARALDIELIDPRGRKYWSTGDASSPWLWLRDKAPEYGLLNGGSWKGFEDWPHFQLA